ncbi:MAG TPA: hypothetical protein VFL14_08730, partial [Xanthomonadales bacterium]|nr:hypothetical protein [Xanthomonadales bacterium]
DPELHSDCPAISFTRPQTIDGNGMDFYALIGGNFGDEIGSRTGFIVERSCGVEPADGDTHLINSTFIPFGTPGQGLPPNRWYRLEASRTLVGFPVQDGYQYKVSQKVGGQWQQIGATIDVPASKLSCGDGHLPMGYVGTGAFPGFPSSPSLHYDFDNFNMNW